MTEQTKRGVKGGEAAGNKTTERVKLTSGSCVLVSKDNQKLRLTHYFHPLWRPPPFTASLSPV